MTSREDSIASWLERAVPSPDPPAPPTTGTVNAKRPPRGTSVDKRGFLASLGLREAYDLACSTAVPSGRWRGNTPTTYLYAINVVQRVIPTLGDLTRESLGAYKVRRLTVDKLQAQTVAGHFNAIGAVVDELRDQGYDLGELLALVRDMRPPPPRKPVRRAEHLSRREFETVALHARDIEPRLELPLRVCVWSGVRVSELSRIRLEDFNDLRGRNPVLRVEDQEDELGEEGRAKTGFRTVPVCRVLQELVLEHAPRSGFLFPPLPSRKPRHGFVHSREHVSMDMLQWDMTRLREVAPNLPYVTWNILRHTRASWWAQAGVPRMKVAEWLGNTEDVCERYYIGLPQAYDADVEKAPPLESPPRGTTSRPRDATPASGLIGPFC